MTFQRFNNGELALSDVEVSSVRSQLTAGEWSFRDARNRGFVLQSGRGSIALKESEVSFAAPCVIWLPSGTSGLVTMQAGTRGLMVCVTDSGIAQAISSGPIAEKIRSVLGLPLVKPQSDIAHAVPVYRTLEALAFELEPHQNGSREAARHHLALFLIGIWRLAGSEPRTDNLSPSRTLVLHFYQTVELHLRDHWPIARYAQELETTPDRLNAVLRRETGTAPLAVIHARLIKEADDLLERSTMQIAEISDYLGFSDPAYFSRFYKRMTGQSPKDQRQVAAERKTSSSFSAWP